MFTINATRILTNHRLCYKISATVTDTPTLNFSIRSVFTVIDLMDYKTSFISTTSTLASDVFIHLSYNLGTKCDVLWCWEGANGLQELFRGHD